MPVSQTALKKLTKDKIIALCLENKGKFDNAFSNINKDLSELRNDFKKIELGLSIFKKCKQQIARTGSCIGDNVGGIVNILDVSV